MTSIEEAPIKLTNSAIGEVKRLLTQQTEITDKVLRIGVKGGGCSGMTYVLEFDLPNSNDVQYEINGVPFVIDKAHSIYLIGMEVDWQGGLNSRGFTFKNPNASSTCGCGTSFAV